MSIPVLPSAEAPRAPSAARRPVLSALGAFLMAGFRPRTPLAKAVVTVLLIKIVVILVLRFTLFSSAERPRIDADSVLAHVGTTIPSSPKR